MPFVRIFGCVLTSFSILSLSWKKVADPQIMPTISNKDTTTAPSTKSHLPICDEAIRDFSTKRQKTQDSIFCDSSCQQWVHHGCAGLSKSRFAQLSKSRDPFLCQQCHLMLLEETVAKLTKEVELLKSHRCEAAPSLSTSSAPQTDYIILALKLL